MFFSVVSSTKRKKANVIRIRWTKEEEKELRELFKDNFRDKTCPRQNEVQQAMKISKERGGQIHKRPQENTKKKVHNMINYQKDKNAR